MTDLLSRLRAPCDHDVEFCNRCDNLKAEAADEIQRLKEEISRVRAEVRSVSMKLGDLGAGF